MILSFALALSFAACLPSIAVAKHRTHKEDCVLRHFLAAVLYTCLCVHDTPACIRLITALVCLLKMSMYRIAARLYVHANGLEK